MDGKERGISYLNIKDTTLHPNDKWVPTTSKFTWNSPIQKTLYFSNKPILRPFLNSSVAFTQFEKKIFFNRCIRRLMVIFILGFYYFSVNSLQGKLCLKSFFLYIIMILFGPVMLGGIVKTNSNFLRSLRYSSNIWTLRTFL